MGRGWSIHRDEEPRTLSIDRAVGSRSRGKADWLHVSRGTKVPCVAENKF